MSGAMFNDIIDEYTDVGVAGRDPARITPTPAGRARNVNEPTIDAVHLLQQIGITDLDKTRFVTETLGYNAAEDLYRTDADDWTNLNERYGNGILNPKDIDLLAGLCTWYSTFEDIERYNEAFDPFEKYGLSSPRDYLRLIADLKTVKARENKAEDGEPNRSVLSHISKLSESFLTGSQVRPEEKPRIKMDLSLYPKIPGKNWTITKAAFTSIASAHGLDAALNGLPDDASEAAVLNHKSNCKLMYSALMLATNSGDDAWIVKSHDHNDSEGVWKAICEWHEGSGNVNTRYQQAMNTLQGIRFNGNSPESFSRHCNQFMEANRILQEIRRPQDPEAICLFFLNSITTECCEMAKQICVSLDYDLKKIILEVRKALQVLDITLGSNIRHSDTPTRKELRNQAYPRRKSRARFAISGSTSIPRSRPRFGES